MWPSSIGSRRRPIDKFTSASTVHDALILAAGVGRRLGQNHRGPKALLDFAGQTLLARHVAALRLAGVARITVVVGHERAAIEAEIARIDGSVDLVVNPSFRCGSVVSLACGRAVLDGGNPVVLMDADVLHDRAMLPRLLASAHPNCLLLDREIEAGDEPVKICLAGDTIVDFAKRPERAHDRVGESIGFFRFDAATARALGERAVRLAGNGDSDLEYEEAIRGMILDGPADRFGYEDVTGLPWTEIDFPEDVERARRLLPLIDRDAPRPTREVP